MDKRMIVCAITAALLGGGLVWAADHRADDGIAGWKTLNAGMAQALGVGVDGEAGSTGAEADGGSEADGKAVNAGGEVVGGGMAGNASVGGNQAGGNGIAGGAVTGGGTAGDGVTGGSMTGNGSIGGNDAGAAGSGIVGGAAISGGTTGAGAATVPAEAGAAGSAAPAAPDGRINVNTADAKALMDLPGIGEKKAQAIIDFRSSKGAFRSANELGKVKGIGPKLLEKLKPLVAF
ncbi:helix-hairpin-helix domain-containing protein [Paenibacillus sp. FSL K6-1096]|uniref:ComEA family DNA-binding protein n=1 Tax=Paenibacillus sp. FSL K6-1096 TaxID=2921460 RepID=UPI0030EE7E8D